MSDRDFIPELVRIGDAAVRVLDRIELSSQQWVECAECAGDGLVDVFHELEVGLWLVHECTGCNGNGGWWEAPEKSLSNTGLLSQNQTNRDGESR